MKEILPKTTSAWALLLMTSLACQTVAKPLDSTNRIAAILNENLPNSLQDKADAIETVLRLLSDIDLPSICHAIMLDTQTQMNSVDDIIALAAKDQHIPFFPSKYPDDVFPVDLQKKMVAIVQPVRDRAMVGMKHLSKQEKNSGNMMKTFQKAKNMRKTFEEDNMIESVSPGLIEKVKLLKGNPTLPAEERSVEDDISESELKMFPTGDIELEKDQAALGVTERPVKYTVIMSDETLSPEYRTQSMNDGSIDVSLDLTTEHLPVEANETITSVTMMESSPDETTESLPVDSKENTFHIKESTVDSKESTVNSKESTVDSKESTVDGKESTVDSKESTVDSKESTLDSKESTVDSKESAVNGKESTVDSKESTVDGKESTVDSKESTVDGKESTVDSKESTNDSKESTVDGKESTVDSKESTVDGKESTVDSKESTVDGKESTVDSKESTNDSKESTVDSKESTNDSKESTNDSKESTSFMKEGQAMSNVSLNTDDSASLIEDGIKQISTIDASPSSLSVDNTTVILITSDHVTTSTPAKTTTNNKNAEFATVTDTKSKAVSTSPSTMSTAEETTEEEVGDEVFHIITMSKNLLSKTKNVESENLKRVFEKLNSLQNDSDAVSIEDELEQSLPPTGEPKRKPVSNLTTENETETTTSPIIVDDYDSVEMHNEYSTYDATKQASDVITEDASDDVNTSPNTMTTKTVANDVITNSTEDITVNNDVIGSTQIIQHAAPSEVNSTRTSQSESSSEEESVSSKPVFNSSEISSDTKLEEETLSTEVSPVSDDPIIETTTQSLEDSTKYNLLGHLLNIHRSDSKDPNTHSQNDTSSEMLHPVQPGDIVTLPTKTTTTDVVLQTTLSPIQQFLKLINQTFELAERTNLTYPYYDAEAAPYDINAVQYATKSLSDLLEQEDDFTATKQFEERDDTLNIVNTDATLQKVNTKDAVNNFNADDTLNDYNTDEALNKDDSSSIAGRYTISNKINGDSTFNNVKTDSRVDKINTDGTLNKIPYYHVEKDKLDHVGEEVQTKDFLSDYKDVAEEIESGSKKRDVQDDYKNGVEPIPELVESGFKTKDVVGDYNKDIGQNVESGFKTKDVLGAYNKDLEPIPEPDANSNLISSIDHYNKMYEETKQVLDKAFNERANEMYDKQFITTSTEDPVLSRIFKPEIEKPYDISDFQKYQRPVDTPFMIAPNTPRPANIIQNDIVKPKPQKPYDISDFQKYQRPVDTPFMAAPNTPRPANIIQNDIVKPKPQKPYDISDFQKYQRPVDTPFMIAPNTPRPVAKEISKPQYRSSLASYPEPSRWEIPQEGPYRGAVFGRQFYNPAYGRVDSGKVRNDWFSINGITNEKFHRRPRVNSLASLGIKQHTVAVQKTPPHSIYMNSQGHACPGLFGYYADITDCGAFFICSWGIPYRFFCPQGTMWNTNEGVCDWAINVNCVRN